ncbi:NADH-quinone oxidoreductase subunit M [Phormidium tenue]|uniref:NAD(P)H-quinone oxidoreductase subunit D4 n=1 Tax=Phormidium tenue NIES-30 TaxID=549789 RepID=A0A1U7J4H4_9CYAN|nr:NADH-quinone oxidoreductase subunit M [Phormidium tenue]MBD2232917.1 NADH-quinone oxidoreductase subunit M [Phormidium tenue FACHB-1052]OKH47405.1 NAD(P)H-quinone oxidoreductase subunit D4 [Phormidium tenue NIES-30]
MLTPLLLIPLIGAIAISLWPGLPSQQARNGALIASGAALLWTLYLFTQFDLAFGGFQFHEFLPWLPALGLNYELSMDGLSLLMVALNSLITWIAIWSSDPQIERPRLFYSLLLLVSSGVAGAFVAQNLMLFFLLYEIELVPLYLLIAIWGGEKKAYAATKFLLYTALSGALMLAGFLGTVWLSGAKDFTYYAVMGHDLPMVWQGVLLGLLLVAFGIKIPLVPFHTWLPDTYVSASTPVAMMLGGVLAKLGTYGLFRFGLGLFPDAWAQFSPYLAGWAAVSVLYGAVTAIAQKDIKRMVAYSSIGHMGYVLLGGAAMTDLALTGALSQMVSHGIILAILFHLVGVIETKVGTRELDVLNGLMNPVRGLPMVSALLVLGGMASAGIPGLVGFVTEFLVFQGSYAAYPVQTLLGVIGTGLTAVYFVILLNRTCFGRLDNAIAYFPKVTFSEKLPAYILAGLILFLGIQPNWLVKWGEPTASLMVANLPFVTTEVVADEVIQQIPADVQPDGGIALPIATLPTLP